MKVLIVRNAVFHIFGSCFFYLNDFKNLTDSKQGSYTPLLPRPIPMETKTFIYDMSKLYNELGKGKISAKTMQR